MALNDFPWKIGDSVKFIRQWMDKDHVIGRGAVGIIKDIGFDKIPPCRWLMSLEVSGRSIELVPVEFVVYHADEPMKSASESQVGGDHYRNMKIQPVEFIIGNAIPYLEGNVIKYICRHRSKGGAEDLKKAKHYIDLLLQHDYPEEK